MRVYIIRHAIAVNRDAPGVTDDASRELTREGITKWRRSVRGLAKLEIELDRIFTSPFLRARQTAEILAESLPRAGAVRTSRALAPGGAADQVLATLARHGTLQNVAAVGHEPDLSLLAGRLLTGHDGSLLRLKKGGVACIELENLDPLVPGELLWLLTPRQLRAMA